MYRIALELDKITNPGSGLGEFSSQLMKSLVSLPNSHYHFLLLGRSENQFVKLKRSSEFHKISSLHKYLPGLSPSCHLWHMTHQLSDYYPPKASIPMLLTVHDLNFSTEKQGLKKHYYLKQLQKRVTRASQIVTISKQVKEDLLSHCQVNVPVDVIYNGVSKMPDHSSKPPYAPSSPFLFAVANMLPHKNFHQLIEMMKFLPNYRLVLAGNHSTPYGQKLIKQKNGSKKFVISGAI